ncbi:hypothetical protein LJB78_00655, partial [Bacteroidales bacterium OttesenSCG-928-J16]|nr:hypothetical protein [Bacteroidales bacterium OttesenSCG-928-J16]
LIALCFSSCNFKKDKANVHYPYYSIDNPILKEEILLYHNSVDIPASKSLRRMMRVQVGQNFDTTAYFIHFAGTMYSLTYSNTIFAKIDNLLVAITYKGTHTFSMSEETVREMAKDVFPEEYSYYQKNGDYPIPMTARGIVWILRFKGDEFIDKEIYGP